MVDNSQNVAWVMHGVVAVSSVIATLTLILNRRLRLHSVALLVSAAGWVVLHFLIYPPGWKGELGDGVLFNCGSVFLGFFHLLFCVALGVGIVRERLRT